MENQGKYPCLILNDAALSEGEEAVQHKITEFAQKHPRFYIVPDYENDEQGRRIADFFGDTRLLTGGSGILAHLAGRYKEHHKLTDDGVPESRTKGPAILLAGSCSSATRTQVQNYIAGGGKALKISPVRLMNGNQTLDEIWRFVELNYAPLIYSSGSGGTREAEEDQEKASAVLERTMSSIARRAFENGYKRIIVAGGETSGAVMLALGFDSFLIGESIAPGVPVMIPANQRDVRLALKSGNFGQTDFFKRVLEQTKG